MLNISAISTSSLQYRLGSLIWICVETQRGWFAASKLWAGSLGKILIGGTNSWALILLPLKELAQSCAQLQRSRCSSQRQIAEGGSIILTLFPCWLLYRSGAFVRRGASPPGTGLSGCHRSHQLNHAAEVGGRREEESHHITTYSAGG